jgi:hypothetical protein
MNEKIQKISEDIQKQFTDFLQTKEVQDMIAVIKSEKDAGEKYGRFKMAISTEDVDRQGEVIMQDGIDASLYMQNPVVLWAHDYSSAPIGMAEKVYRDGNKTIAEGIFAPTEKAQEIRQLYDLKIQRASSVGIIPLEMEGNTITKSQLLEFSFVPVPANPYALSLMKTANLQPEVLMQKGLVYKSEEAAEGGQPADEQQQAGNESDEAEKIAPGADLGEQTGDTEAKKGQNLDLVEKSGRVLSDKNRKVIEQTVSDLQKTIAVLNELLAAASQGSEGEEDPEDGGSPKQRSSGAGSELKEFDQFLLMHQVLRIVNIKSSEALEKFNALKRKK